MPTREESYAKLKKAGIDEAEITVYLDEQFPKSEPKQSNERENAYNKLKKAGIDESEISAYLEEKFPSQKKKETPSEGSGVGSGENESSKEEEFKLFEETPQEQQEVDRTKLDERYAKDPSLEVDSEDPMEVQAATKAQENIGIPASEQTAQTTGGTIEGQEEFMADIEAKKQESIDKDKIVYNSHKGGFENAYQILKKKDEGVEYQSRDNIVKRNYEKRKQEKISKLGIATDLKEEKSGLSNLTSIQDKYNTSNFKIKALESNNFAQTVPKVREEINKLKDENIKIESDILSGIKKLKEERVKDRNWGKTKAELQDEKIRKELYKDDNKILSALSDKYLTDATKEGLGDKANALKWSDEKKKKVLESIDFNAQKFIENIDIKDLWEMEGITDKGEILEKYVHEKMIPTDLTTILSYQMTNRGFTPGSGSYREDTEAQEVLRELGLEPSSDILGLVLDPNALEEFKDVTEEEANDALNRLLIADLMVNKKVDPTKIYGKGKTAGEDAEYLGSRVARSLYEGGKEMFFFGGDQDKAKTRARLSSTPKTGSTSMDILRNANLKPLEGMSDRAKKTTIDAWADGAETVANIIPVFIGSSGLTNLGKSALKGTAAANKFASSMVKLEQAALKAETPLKKAMLSLAVKGERAVAEGVTHQVANWVYGQEDLNIVSGTGGSLAGGLVKSILGKYNPSKKGLEVIKNIFSRAMGENIEEITEELIQNDFDLSGMTSDDWMVLLTMSSVMGGAIGGGKKIESDMTKYSDLAGIAKSKLSTEEFNKVKSDLGMDAIEEAYSVGQTVELDTNTGKTDLTNDTDTKTTETPITGETETTTETEQVGGVESDAKKDISEKPSVTTTKKEGIKPSESKTAEEESKRMTDETKVINDSRQAELKSIEGKSKTKEGQEALERDVNERHDVKLEELKDSEKVFNKRGNEVKLTKKEKAQDKEIEKKNKENQPVVDLFNKLKTWNELSTYQQGREVNNNKRKELNDLAQKNGYDLKSVSGTYKLFKEGNVDKDGKPKPSGKPRLLETNKDKAKSKMLLSEESPEFQKDFKKLKETGQLDFYTTGEADANRLDISDFDNDKQFQAGMRDIENGVRSFNAQTILDFVERYRREGNLPMVTGKGDLQALHTVTKEQIDLEAQGVFKKKNMAPPVVQEFISSKRNVDAILDPENEVEGFNELSVEDQDLIYDTAIQLKNNDRAVLDSNGDVYVFDNKDSSKGESIPKKETRESDTSKNLKESSIIPQKTKDNLTEDKTHFEVFSDAQAQKEAFDFIESKESLEVAAKSVTDNSGDFSSLSQKTKTATRVTLMQAIIDKIEVIENTGGDLNQSEQLSELLDVIAQEFVNEGHSAGLNLQAYKMASNKIYDNKVVNRVKARRGVTKSFDRMKKNSKPVTKLTKEITNENKKVVKSKELKKVTSDSAKQILKKKKAEAKRKKTDKTARKKAQKEVESAISEMGGIAERIAKASGSLKSFDGEKSETFQEILNDLKPILIKLANGLIKLGYYNFNEWSQKFNEKIKNKYGEAVSKALEPEAQKIWKEVQENARAEKEYFAQFEGEKAVRKELKDINEKLDDIVKRHYTDVEAAKTSISAKIIKELEVDGETALEIEKNIQNSFDKIATEKKKSIIKRKLTPKKQAVSKAKQEYYDKIIELSNLGALSDAELDAQLKDYLLIDTLNPESMKKLDELSQKVAEAKGENEKNERILDLTDYTMKMQGFSKGETIMAIYLGNLFGGPSTQAINVKSNIQAGMLEPVDLALSKLDTKSGKSMRNMTNAFTTAIKTWAKTLPKGFAEAKNIMSTGHVVHRGISPEARTLEVLRNMSDKELAKHSPFGKTKLGIKASKGSIWFSSNVFRALAATDAMFFISSNQAKQAVEIEFEHNKIKDLEPNSKDADTLKKIYEQMHPSSEYFKSQKSEGGQAYNEVKKSFEEKFPNKEFDAKKHKTRIERRAWELLEDQKNKLELGLEEETSKEKLERIKEESELYAAYSTYTNKPNGILGDIANFMINPMLKRYPSMKIILPVVNTAVNVTNRALDHTFVGMVNVLAAKKGWSKGKTQEFYDKMAPLILAKSIRGTATLVTTFAMFTRMFNEEDDEKNLFEEMTGMKVRLHGSGPKDYKKTKQLKDQRWIPNSIQIGDKYFSYTTSPLAFVYRMVGDYNDEERYDKKVKPNEDVAMRVISSMTAITKFAAEGGPVEGSSEMLSSFFKDYDDIGKLSTMATKFSGKVVGNMIPLGNFSRQMLKIADSGKQVDRNNWKGAMTYAIPMSHHLIDGANVQLAWDGRPVENFPGVDQWFSWSNDKINNLKTEKKIFFTPIHKKTTTIFSSSEDRDIRLDEHDDLYHDLSKKYGEFLRKGMEENQGELKKLNPENDEDLLEIDNIKSDIQSEAKYQAKEYISESRKYKKLFK